MKELTLKQPDDWHIHCRDGAYLERTVADAANTFARAIIMPNLAPPLTEVAQIKAYRQRILAAIPEGKNFTPLMTLYLTDSLPLDIIAQAKQEGIIAAKLYPAGATTHSEAGVTDIKYLYPLFEEMQKQQMLLLIHGEVTDNRVDIFDRESVFIETQLAPLVKQFPHLKIVLEHISTKKAVEFVEQSPDNVAATITAHHLLINRNHLLVGGIKPHHYCLPIVKRATDQQALMAAASSGNPKFFLGTDSAPHAKSKKESACGCAGIYTAHIALECYATAFENIDALDKLENFASVFGAEFYGLPVNQNTLTLVRQPQTVAKQLQFGDEVVIPFLAGETINWRIKNN